MLEIDTLNGILTGKNENIIKSSARRGGSGL